MSAFFSTSVFGRAVVKAPPISWILVLALLAATVFVAVVSPAPAARAADPGISTLEARLDDHVPYTGAFPGGAIETDEACIRFVETPTGTLTGNHLATSDMPGGATAWVGNGTTAWAAHGSDGGSCPDINQSGPDPSSLDLDEQSAIGFEPVATTGLSAVPVGSYFNLGRFIHNNNPIQSPSNYYRGELELDINGSTMVFDYEMNETPNVGDGNNEASRDTLEWLNNTVETSFTQAGIEYTVVLVGFIRPQSGNTCSGTVDSTFGMNDFFYTWEREITYGCLYASLQQVRDVTIEKQVDLPYGLQGATIPSFDFETDSELNNPGWVDGSNDPETFSLLPSESTPDTEGPIGYVTTDEVTITEVDPDALPAGWELTSMQCVDEGDNVLSGAAYDYDTGTITLDGVPGEADPDLDGITCTFTNTFTPTSGLTLVKNVDSDDMPVQYTPAAATDWTLSATRQTGTDESVTGATFLSGAGGASGTVASGTYALGEASTNPTSTSGYVDGIWVCTDDDTGGNVEVVGGEVQVDAGQDVACEITNTFETGTLRIAKVVTGDGYEGGTAASFLVDYTCTVPGRDPISDTGVVIHPAASNGAPGAVVTVPNIPAGASCVVTESTAHVGTSTGLVDTSWTWSPPSSVPADGTVVIDPKSPNLVTFTNANAQQFGSLRITKTVEPPTNHSGAWIGGNDREFTANYTCSIDGDVVASGSGAVSIGTDLVITGIPATAECDVTEDSPVTEPGDFTTASYVWTGAAPPVNDVPIVAGQEARADLTNTYRYVSEEITVEKELLGWDVNELGESPTFTGNIYCGNSNYRFSIADGTDDTVWVPVGVTCSVTEVTPGAVPGFEWAAVDYSFSPSGAGTGDTTFVVQSGDEVTVTVTNELIRTYGKISVTKAIDEFASAVASDAEFDIRVQCDAPALGSGTNYDHTFAIDWNGGSPVAAVTPLLPDGADCTISEVTPSGYLIDESFAWDGYSVSPSSTVEVTAQATPLAVTVTNDIDRVYASLTITKVVAGVAGPTPATFSGTYSCQYGSDTPVSGTWSVGSAGGTATLSPDVDFLIGSDCTVTENTVTSPLDPSYSWTTVGGDQSGVVIAANGGSATVTNTLSRATGAVNISKSVSDAAAVAGDAEFAFAYRCESADTGDVYTNVGGTPVMVGVGDTVAIPDDIPAGSTCTVWELDANLPVPNDPWRWDGVTYDGVAGGTTGEDGYTFTTPVDNPDTEDVDESAAAVTVSATNSYSERYGSVTVSKSLTGETVGFTGGSDAIFPVTLVCDSVNYGTKNVAAGGSVSFTGIPLGTTDCAVTEGEITGGLADGSFGWGTVSYSDPVGVTSEQTPARLTVTNDIVRVYGTVQLSKDVQVGDYAGVVSSGLTYSGGWQCVYTGPGDVPNATVSGTWSGVDASHNDGGTLAMLTPSGGSAASSVEVLIGSVCTPTEPTIPAPSADTSFEWAAPGLHNATAASAVATMRVVNTLERDTADIMVEKTLSGVADGLVDGTVFPVTASCQLGDAPIPWVNTVDVVAGASAVILIADVPVGWTCTVSEGAPDGPDGFANGLANESYIWGAYGVVEIDGDATDEVVVSSEGHLASVDNTINRAFGGFAIDKYVVPGTNVANLPDLSGIMVEGTYRCEVEGEEPQTGSWGPIEVGTAIELYDLYAGSSCEITEIMVTNPIEADPSYFWGTPIQENSVAIIAQQQQILPRVSLTNVLARAAGDFSVEKSADPESGSTVLPGSPITYSVTLSVAALGASGEIVITDDLSGVLAYAELQSVAAPDGTTTVLDGTNLVWTVGSLDDVVASADFDAESGELVLSYTVIVDDDARGVQLTNVVTVTEDEEPPGGVCEEGECTTTHMTPAWTLNKSSDPESGTVVVPGSTITYTLEVDNTAEVLLQGATVTDDLSDVLDNATIESLGDGLTLVDDTLTWAVPDVAPGESVEVSYSVLVSDAETPVTLRNVATPGTPGGECEVCSTEHVTPRVLAATGANGVAPIAALGAVLMAFGAALAVLRRRREG